MGNKGHCIAPMATTHVSEVRAEMPSGMVPLRELESRTSSLHPGEHMHTHQGTTAAMTTTGCDDEGACTHRETRQHSHRRATFGGASSQA